MSEQLIGSVAARELLEKAKEYIDSADTTLQGVIDIKALSYDLTTSAVQYGSLSAAIAAVPAEERKVGLHVVYLNSNNTVSEVQFLGNSVSDWEDTDYWRDCAGLNAYYDGTDTLVVKTGAYYDETNQSLII